MVENSRKSRTLFYWFFLYARQLRFFLSVFLPLLVDSYHISTSLQIPDKTFINRSWHLISLIVTSLKMPIGDARINQRAHHKWPNHPSHTCQSLQTGGKNKCLNCPWNPKNNCKLINTTDIGYNILLAKLQSFNAEKAWPESAI